MKWASLREMKQNEMGLNPLYDKVFFRFVYFFVATIELCNILNVKRRIRDVKSM